MEKGEKQQVVDQLSQRIGVAVSGVGGVAMTPLIERDGPSQRPQGIEVLTKVVSRAGESVHQDERTRVPCPFVERQFDAVDRNPFAHGFSL